MAGGIRVGLPATLFQKPPVDHPAEPGQCMFHIDDLIEPCAEMIILPAVSPLLRKHPNAP